MLRRDEQRGDIAAEGRGKGAILRGEGVRTGSDAVREKRRNRKAIWRGEDEGTEKRLCERKAKE